MKITNKEKVGSGLVYVKFAANDKGAKLVKSQIGLTNTSGLINELAGRTTDSIAEILGAMGDDDELELRFVVRSKGKDGVETFEVFPPLPTPPAPESDPA